MKHTPEKLNTSSNDEKKVLFERKELVDNVNTLK